MVRFLGGGEKGGGEAEVKCIVDPKRDLTRGCLKVEAARGIEDINNGCCVYEQAVTQSR